jgi:hypothetical protein
MFDNDSEIPLLRRQPKRRGLAYRACFPPYLADLPNQLQRLPQWPRRNKFIIKILSISNVPEKISFI